MAKYDVELIMHVEIEANSAEEAEQIALEQYMRDDSQYAIATLVAEDDGLEEDEGDDE
jgi:hypothetical protein